MALLPKATPKVPTPKGVCEDLLFSDSRDSDFYASEI